MITKADEVWQIEKLVPGGDAMARLPDGRIGFVAGALPGERILAEQVESKKGYRRAHSFRVLQPAPERITPDCPVSEVCGGCDWLHIAREAGLAYKGSLIEEALRRTGGFAAIGPVEVEASPRREGYRSRIRLHIDTLGRLGFHGKKSHQLVEVTSCRAALAELDVGLARVRQISAEFPRMFAMFKEAELRSAAFPPHLSLRLVPRQAPDVTRRAARSLLSALSREFEIAVTGTPTDFVQRFPLPEGGWLEAPPEAFVQVNWDVNLRLVEAVLAGARARHARSYVDVYAGAGNFTLPLARAGICGVSIEGHAAAARAAERSLAAQGLFSRVVVIVDDAQSALDRLSRESEAPDLCVLDPPRAGALSILESLCALGPRAIAYCSCDPVTLARDLRGLVARGYRLDSVQGFDMFPGTHHVETLAWLSLPVPSAASFGHYR